jgi:hypothetical protein
MRQGKLQTHGLNGNIGVDEKTGMQFKRNLSTCVQTVSLPIRGELRTHLLV